MLFLILYTLILSKWLFFLSFHRHEANSFKKTQKLNAKKKTSRVKITNKAGENKFNKGKNFSGPRQQGGKRGRKKWTSHPSYFWKFYLVFSSFFLNNSLGFSINDNDIFVNRIKCIFSSHLCRRISYSVWQNVTPNSPVCAIRCTKSMQMTHRATPIRHTHCRKKLSTASRISRLTSASSRCIRTRKLSEIQVLILAFYRIYRRFSLCILIVFII